MRMRGLSLSNAGVLSYSDTDLFTNSRITAAGVLERHSSILNLFIEADR